MDGLKTMLVAAVTAILNAFVAFGVELTEEQKVAILGLVGAVGVPLAIFVARFFTSAPMRGLEGLQRKAGVL